MYDSSTVKVASSFNRCWYFEHQDTLIEQSLIPIEQSSLYSKPQVFTLTYYNRIALSILKVTSYLYAQFIHNNTV